MKGAVFTMKLLFKVISLPFILTLSIINPFLTFLFCISEKICTLVAFLLAGFGILMWLTGMSLFHSAALVIMGFLVSPFGLHGAIQWLIERMYDLNDALKSFVMS